LQFFVSSPITTLLALPPAPWPNCLVQRLLAI
jgi:hypothetical protein